MATEIIREQSLTNSFNPSRLIGWVTAASAKVSKKYLMIGAPGGVVLALAAYYFWGGGASAAQYLTAKVERGSLRNTVTATGTLQAVTTVQVGSQASGTLSALYADFNSTAKKEIGRASGRERAEISVVAVSL